MAQVSGLHLTISNIAVTYFKSRIVTATRRFVWGKEGIGEGEVEGGEGKGREGKELGCPPCPAP